MDKQFAVAIIKSAADEWYAEPSRLRRSKDVEMQSYRTASVDSLCKYIFNYPADPKLPYNFTEMIEGFQRRMREGRKQARNKRAKQMFAAGDEVASDMKEIFLAME